MSVSNREVNSINSWRCISTTMIRFIIASARALLRLIFCSVRSTFALKFSVVLKFLQLAVYNKHGNCPDDSTHRRRHYLVSREKFPRCHWLFLRCLRQIRTCSISLARRVLDLALRKILCKLFSLRCVALFCVRCVRKAGNRALPAICSSSHHHHHIRLNKQTNKH